jgi:GNAT superfamily N-acetyltransferase
MEIRDAVPEDAPAASEVIRRSISELCHTDRLNDPVIFGRWLESGTILAVGSVTDGGEITLNYVSSDARFRGVSRALLAALETRGRNEGTGDAPYSIPKRRIASTDPQGTRTTVHPKASLVRLRATRCRSN